MNTTPVAKNCPKCGAPVPPEAAQGLCPKCLLAAVSNPAHLTQTGDTRPVTISAEAAASAFPHLEIIEFIGQGGMGVVYKARQPKLDRFVALKLLGPAIGADPAFAERFNREARLLARLQHPNIVAVHDFGQSGSYYYLLMEFVDGVNLRQAMQAGRFTPPQALALVPKICEALQYAHDEGVLHRDIKPENILLDTRGRVKIADFGIAKLLGDKQANGVTLTASGAAVGTPHYMAPEQLEHPREVDQRADIYSLGVVFYEMLTGELPIGRFAPPSEKSAVDPRVDEVVFHALEKEREKRFHSANEVKTSVEAITAHPAAAAPGFEAPGAKASSSHRPSIPERRTPCYVSTPEHLRTYTGRALYIYTGKGELRLNAETLTFVSDWQALAIPVETIKELRIGHYPRWAKPIRLDYVAVTYEQGGQRRTVLFTPCRSPLSTPWETNQQVAECLVAVRDAVIARTGAAPTGSSADPIRSRGFPAALVQALRTALPAVALGGAISALAVFVLLLRRRGLAVPEAVLSFGSSTLVLVILTLLALGVVALAFRLWHKRTGPLALGAGLVVGLLVLVRNLGLAEAVPGTGADVLFVGSSIALVLGVVALAYHLMRARRDPFPSQGGMDALVSPPPPEANPNPSGTAATSAAMSAPGDPGHHPGAASGGNPIGSGCRGAQRPS